MCLLRFSVQCCDKTMHKATIKLHEAELEADDTK